MKKCILILLLSISSLLLTAVTSQAQCSVCTRTAQQLGEKPAKGMNSGIIYLALTPFAIVGFIFYRWRKNESNG